MGILLEFVRPYMENVARGYADPLRADESTSDLVQEAWVRAWQKLDQFEGGRSEEETAAMFHGWVGQIVNRLGSNMRRDQGALKRSPGGGFIHSLERQPGRESGNWPGMDVEGSGSSPSTVLRRDEAEELVRQALERIIDPTDREIIHLRFFDGVSLRRIAERLDLDYHAVRERYALSLVKLENQLGGLV